MDPVGRRSPRCGCRIAGVRPIAPIEVSRVIDAIAAAHDKLRHDGVREANAGRKVMQITLIQASVAWLVIDDFAVYRDASRRADRIEGVQIEIRLLVMPRSHWHLDVIAEAEVQGELSSRLPIVLNVHSMHVVRGRRICVKARGPARTDSGIAGARHKGSKSVSGAVGQLRWVRRSE